MSGAIHKIACAISGGVDSCVAAILLKNRGYAVQGVFMRNWDIADEKGYCQADQDKADAEYVCRKLDIPLVEVNFVKEYWNEVFSYLISEYKKGLTPNPDILCNKKIKFDSFYTYALEHLKADAVATGHYARVVHDAAKGVKMLMSLDQEKDQTFFLSQISKNALSKSIFPVGELTKTAVKKIAISSGFARIAKKKESAGICFIGKRKFQSFIDEYIEPIKGNFVNLENGKIVGVHKGIHCWTNGQRCLIPGQPTAFYVAERNASSQDILVVPGQHHPALYHQTLLIEQPYWLRQPPADLENRTFCCDFRFQHRKPLVKCLLYQGGTGCLQVLLEQPQRALTLGQFAAFYSGEECLGGGRIVATGPSMYSLTGAKTVRL